MAKKKSDHPGAAGGGKGGAGDGPANKITVKVGAFPGGQIKPYSLNPGVTLEQALQAAGYQSPKGLDIRVNGQPTSDLAAPLADGAQVLIFSQIRGN